MADEKQGQINNPYAISAEPFSPALDPQQYVSTAPPTVSGSGSKVEGTAMIADKFLEGFSRGRKMAFDRQEQSRNRLNQDINDAYGRIDKSDIPEYSDDPNATTKAKLRGRLDALKYADMYKEVHESKDKDNPAIKTLKSAFEGLVGPKPKKFEFGPAQVHQTLSGIWSDMDKAQTGPQLAEKAANDLTQYYSQNYGQPEGQPAAQPQGQPQQQAPPAQSAPAQQQSPNILPYGPGAQQTAPPPGGPPQGQIQQPQAGAPAQQMPTVMRQPAPRQAQTPPPPGAQPQQPVAPPSQATSKDVMKDPEFMKRLNRVLTLDPKNPTAQLIVDRVKENDKLRSSKSLAEDIKGISGKAIRKSNPNAKDAFGGPVDDAYTYTYGKDDRLYPIDTKAAAAAKPHNLKTVWAFVEGKEDPVEAYSDPQDPSAPLRAVIGGQTLDNVIKTETSGEITVDIRSKSYGTFGEFYRSARGVGMSNAEAMEDAGKKTYKALGIRLGRTQQEEAIDAMLTGVGAGDPFKGQTGKPTATPPTTPTAAPPGAPSTKPSQQGALFMAPGPATGLITPGNIDLRSLPPVELGNGKWGTVNSASREVNGKEILYPTIVNGKQLSDDEAFASAMKSGKNLGVFKDGKTADTYAQRLHSDWEAGKIPGAQMRPGDPNAKPAATPNPPGAAPKAAPKPTNTAAAITPQQLAKTAEEDKNIDIYLGDLMGTTKVSGKATVRKLAGQDALARRTGLSPSEFQAAAAVDKDRIKALGDTVERYAALQRLNSIMDRFTPNILDLAKSIPQTGSPWLTKKWRDIKLEAVDDPNIRQYLVALNDFQRQYATVTSGGGLSRAQLPVSTAENVDRIVDPNATLGGVIGLVNQIKTQAVLEQNGMKDSLDKLKGEVKDSALGAASAGKTPPPPNAPRRKVWNPATNKFDDK